MDSLYAKEHENRMRKYLRTPKKKSLVVFISIAFCISMTGCEQQNGDQMPPLSMDNIFDFYFFQNFESKIPGIYKTSEWESDWNYPEWASRQVPTEIMAESSDEDTSQYMRWYFPEGGVGPGEGGGQWYTKLEDNIEEVYFSYNLRFKPGFQWVGGGKVPGLRGGPRWDGVGAPPYEGGFVALLMWKNPGNLAFYYYHHDLTHDYGDLKIWDYPIETGRWYNITVRIVLNTVGENGGNNDGIMEGFIDGQLVASIDKLRFRNLESIGIDNLYVTTFFGGSGDEFASVRDEWIDMDDFAAFTYKPNISVPRGNTASKTNGTIMLPFQFDQ